MTRITPGRVSAMRPGRGRRARSPGSFRWRRSRPCAGVSEVVATILLLALTVTLFSALFFFVNFFKGPPPQPLNQFQASLAYGGSAGKQIKNISIIHLTGPAISGAGTAQVAIYLASQNKTAAFSGPFALSAGLPGGSSTWTFGTTWLKDLSSYSLNLPDNITVSVVANGQLLFQTVLRAALSPPSFTSLNVVPSPVKGNAAYNVTVGLIHSGTGLAVTANLAQLGGGTSVAMKYSAKSGLFYVTGTANDPTTGTYAVFVTATDTGGSASGQIPVPFTHV